jgi:hypothetical protein
VFIDRSPLATVGHIAAAFALTSVAACVPNTPEARRAAYLDCARDQGLVVENDTIRTSSADLSRLDACEALPR